VLAFFLYIVGLILFPSTGSASCCFLPFLLILVAILFLESDLEKLKNKKKEENILEQLRKTGHYVYIQNLVKKNLGYQLSDEEFQNLKELLQIRAFPNSPGQPIMSCFFSS